MIRYAAIILFFCGWVQLSSAQNIMQIHNINATAGNVVTLELEIINTNAFVGFNLDIPLPEGFSYINGTATLLRKTNHFLMVQTVGNDVVRFVSFSPSLTPYPGNDGVIVTINLQTPATDGTYLLEIFDAIIANNNGGNIITETVPGTVTLTGGEPPPQYELTVDTTGNGSVLVNGNLYTAPVSVAQGTVLTLEAAPDASWSFDGWSGDLAGDQSPFDIVMNGDKHVTAAFSEAIPTGNIMQIHNINATAGEVVTVELEIINEDEFVEFGLNILLPNGFSYIDGTAKLYRDDGHILNFNISSFFGMNFANVQSYAEPDKPFVGNNGVILSFDLQTPDDVGNYTLAIDNAQILNATGTNILTHYIPGTVTLADGEPPPQYELTVDITGNGSVFVNGSPYTEPLTVAEGTVLTLDAAGDPGWGFDGWSGDLAGDQLPATLLMNSHKNVTAKFSEASAEGNIMLINNITALGGSVVKVELEIINDDEFAGFNLDIPLPEGFSYIEGTAQLHRDNGHFLEFEIIGDNTARMLSAAFPTTPFIGNSGVVVSFNLQTPANEGTYILNIVEAVISDAEGDNIMTGSIPGTVTLTEVEPPPQYELTVDITGNGSVFVNGNLYTAPVSVDQGTTLTLAAEADAGWSFDGWSGHLSGNQSPVDIVIDGDKTVAATFSQVSPTGNNIMQINNITASASDVITVELEIINDDEFVGFNLDIPLPEGFSYIENTAQLHRDSGHFFEFEIVSDNTARMLSAAFPTTPFTGNSGVVVSFNLETPANEGTYILDIVDAVISDAAGTNIMTGHTAGTLVLDTAEGLPDNLSLNDLHINEGPTECFSALISIITAGGNTSFIVYNGGSAELVAGQSIHMLPGTIVENGGYLLARIAAHENDYCGMPIAVDIAEKPVTPKNQIVSAGLAYEPPQNGFFKLYPNPTNGSFTLELTVAEPDQTIAVEAHNMLGGRLFAKELPPQRLHMLSLEGQQPGIYIIRVIHGDQIGVKRLIKR